MGATWHETISSKTPNFFLALFKEIIIISYFHPFSFMPNSTNEESGENNTATSSPSHAIIKC